MAETYAKKVVEYHGHEWDLSVEDGWVTHEVFEKDGVRWAVMLRSNWYRRTWW